MANWNEKAKQLLPCDLGEGEEQCTNGHPKDYCSAYYRPAVATALAEEADRWYSLGRADEILQPEADKLRAEVADLKAERDGVLAALSTLHEGCCVTPADRQLLIDAAAVQGLEIAMGLCFDSRTPNIANAIQAEIDKRKGK